MMDFRVALLRRGAAGLLIASALTASACDERLSDITGPSPNLKPTLSSISTEIFQTTDIAGRVACVTCHTNVGHAPAGNLNLAVDPYAALVNVASSQRPGAVLVIPGDPESSYLVRKIEGRDINGLRMPRSGAPFMTDGQISVIRRWIEIGAPRD
jgi:hypothetical protein